MVLKLSDKTLYDWSRKSIRQYEVKITETVSRFLYLFKRFTGLNQFNSTPLPAEPFDFDVAKNATRKDFCNATRVFVNVSLCPI